MPFSVHLEIINLINKICELISFEFKKHSPMITEVILKKELNIPYPFNEFVYGIVLIFIIYCLSKITYNVLSIFHGCDN